MSNSSKVTAADVAHVAKLANIPLSDEQQQQFVSAFRATLQEINTLLELDTDSVEPTFQISSQTNVWRADKIDTKRQLSQDEALSQADHSYKGYVVVDRIIEEE